MPVLVIATTAEADHIPLSVQSCFKHDISIAVRRQIEQIANQSFIPAGTGRGGASPDLTGTP